MPLIILHDLDDDEVLVNTDTLTAAKRKYPDERSQISEPFTKLYFVSKDKTMESLGFPDSVKETPAEIVSLSKQ
ncbi:MAG: hypothetical protein DI626_01665 [Micavibrio aeruginosavorus]|uniref:Uncharacterized protein n=1 Tax=Micavibrio aeruginosavorus TaxID=349221 RepID=A0A2W5A7M3_9BACT|nr:MAG: hypothetical protein DI626_01665 [Micavibrio aeruginosavorus]